MSGEQILFWLFAILACAGAIGVVVNQIVVRMAVSLIVCLASVSALFFLQNADFVGAVQLMVYVGGTIILLIFGIMLTSSSPFSKIESSPAEGFLAAGIGALFLAIIAFTVTQVNWEQQSAMVSAVSPTHAVESGYNPEADGNTSRPLAMSFLGLRPDQGGNAPGYLLPFEIVSVHLLVVLIGAAYLARTKRVVAATEAGGAGIPVSSGVSASPYAGGFDRFCASIVDGIILCGVLAVVDGLLAKWLLEEVSINAIVRERQLSLIGLVFCLAELIVSWLYFAGMHSSKGQATFGKALFGLAVCGYDNQRISFKQATVRFFGRIVSSVLLCLGFVLILFTEKAQGLHDFVGKTLVVRR